MQTVHLMGYCVHMLLAKGMLVLTFLFITCAENAQEEAKATGGYYLRIVCCFLLLFSVRDWSLAGFVWILGTLVHLGSLLGDGGRDGIVAASVSKKLGCSSLV